MLAATLIDRMHAPLSDEMVQEALIQVCVCTLLPTAHDDTWHAPWRSSCRPWCHVCGLLSSPRPPDAMWQVLGFGAIELIGAVFPQRAAINTSIRQLMAAAEASAEAAIGNSRPDGGGLGGGLGGSSIGGSGGREHGPFGGGGCGVSMTSQSAQRQEKQRRKEAAKHAKEKRRAALEEERTPEELEVEVAWLAAGARHC